jgi:hypothetical protein
MASQGGTVFIERRDSLMIGRKTLTQHVVSVFDVDADAKLSAWRDYYDSVEFAVKLGADVNTVLAHGSAAVLAALSGSEGSLSGAC